jgi:hypothetical protein
LTHEIFNKLREQAPDAQPAYNFELALQAPVLEMMLRGFRVDPGPRELAIQETRRQLDRQTYIINQLAQAVWDRDLNPNSGQQLKELFYGRLAVPEIKAWIKGELKFPMDRSIIEQVEDYFQARPIAACVLEYRNLEKQLQVLETEVDRDWRMRTSYNIGGTKSARFSSSKSPTGTGGNLQNISEELRHILIPDPGHVLCGIDASQSDSRMVGYMCGLLFDDWGYLDACESGDLHTAVAKMTWPDLKWTGDLKKDKAIAEVPFYRHFTYRDCCKKLGHGCLTEDHEVLTPLGWVPIATKPSVIMQFDPIQKISTFTLVNTWVDKMWSGPFCEWDNLSLSIKMTGPHRVYYTTTTDEKLAVTSALHVPSSARIPLGEGYSNNTSSDWTPSLARLLAAYQCDGDFSGVGRQARFHMKKARKFDRLEELALDAGLLYSQGEDKTKAAVTIDNIRDWPKKAGSYLLNWPTASLEAYLDEFQYWDGTLFESGSTRSLTLSSVDKEHLDWIRTCNRLVGKGGNISKPYISGFGSTIFRLQINNRLFTNVEQKQRTISEETNRVFCPSVPTQAFYVRRNGKISVTGNTNFLGKAPTLSRLIHIPLNLVEPFQEKYFDGFPAIPMWHSWTAAELQTKRRLVSIHGRHRDFFDRTNADETLRKALAFLAAAATADNLNLGMWRIWRHMPHVHLLAQVHDAVYFQFPETLNPQDVVAEACHHLTVTLTAPNGRKFAVPTEAKLGYNWGNKSEKNPRGLSKDLKAFKAKV